MLSWFTDAFPYLWLGLGEWHLRRGLLSTYARLSYGRWLSNLYDTPLL